MLPADGWHLYLYIAAPRAHGAGMDVFALLENLQLSRLVNAPSFLALSRD